MRAKMRHKIEKEIHTLDESQSYLADYSDEDPEFDDIEEQREIKNAVREINGAIARLERLVQ
jgi:hypothetical protein